MDPLTLGLIGGGIGALGDLAGSAIQGIFNSGQAQEQRDYETQMADTTYQRGEADLKAAGLNPVLAAGGAVDPTPSVSAATISAPDIGGGFTSGYSSGVSSATAEQSYQQAEKTNPVTVDILKQNLLNLQATGALTQDQVEQLDNIVSRDRLLLANQTALQEFNNLVLQGKAIALSNSGAASDNAVKKFNAMVAAYSSGPLGVSAKAVGNIILPYAAAAVGAAELLKP